MRWVAPCGFGHSGRSSRRIVSISQRATFTSVSGNPLPEARFGFSGRTGLVFPLTRTLGDPRWLFAMDVAPVPA